MNAPKASIIIPVYKSEKWLDRCIKSILRQTYTDFELILVDDGSPDNSGKICDEFAERDDRIKVIHKSNGGVSSARNAGLDVAEGEMIGFVDSDDFVSEQYLEHLIKDDVDLSVSGLTWAYSEENKTICLPNSISITDIKEEVNSVLNLFYNRFLDGPCQKLYKKEIIDRIKLRFDDRLALGEDTIFVLTYFLEVSSLYACPYSDYYYDIKDSSSLTRIRHHSNTTNLFALEMYELLKKIRNKNHIHSIRFDGYMDDKFLTYMFMGWYTLYYKSHSDEERLNYIRKIKCEILERKINIYNKYISKKNKLIYLILSKCPISLGDKAVATIMKIMK